MAGQNTLTLDDGNFEAEVLRSSQPVLVDFWAEWCGPCQVLGPTIDELANDYAGKVKVGKVDIDKAQATAQRYGVTSIPTVMLFDNGQAVERVIGVKNKAFFQQLLRAKAGTG